MSLIGLLVLVVAAGALLSVQAVVNGRLGQVVGILRSSQLTFVVGAVSSALLVLFLEPDQLTTVLQLPKWQLTGAVFGVIYVTVMVTAVPRVGVAVATVAVIFGQLGGGMLIDNFGWLDNPAIDLSWNRIFAMLCLGLALIFMYRATSSNSVG